MALLPSQLQQIREEVGSQPDDATLNGLFDTLGDVIKVELAVLRPRLADALTAAAEGGFTLAGVLTATAPAQPTYLAQQVSRLEAALAAENGDDTTGSALGATSVLAGRYDRPR